MSSYIPGLEGVVAAQTELSCVDGEAGRLHLRGVPLLEAVAQGFEPAAALLLGPGAVSDALPELGRLRVRAHSRQLELRGLPTEPMARVRAAVASSQAQGAALIAEVSVAMVHAGAALAGRAPLHPDPHLDHATDLLQCLRAEPPHPEQAHALSIYLATVLDHGLNASTFAARVVVSTGSDDCSGVCAALGALAGPLHGGAPGPVLDMLDAVAQSAGPQAWVRAELQAGSRIMGMGHRVYRVRDPRAAALEAALGGLDSPRLALARRVEAQAQAQLAARYPERKLMANVEFYTALLLEAVGVERALFTPMFASARVVGWLAHMAEQRARGRMLRPRAQWVGEALGEDRVGER